MKLNIFRLSSIAIAVAVAGCASDLTVTKDFKTDIDDAAKNGVPVNLMQAYVVKGVLTKHSSGKSCDQTTPYTEFALLPTGDRFYIGVKPALFGKADFGLSFSEKGNLSEVTMNSDPKVAENITAVAGLITAAVSLLRPGTPTKEEEKDEEPADTGENLQAEPRKIPCTTGKVMKKIIPYEKLLPDEQQTKASAASN